MVLGPRLDLRQSQSLVMTPQLQQAIKLLQMSNVELTDYIEQEIEQNPLLEREDAIHTNGIRIYWEYRWKRLAKLLFQSEKHYENIFSNCNWSTDIWQDNIASCKWFERSGYIYMANWKNINNWKMEDNNRRIYVKLAK